MRRLSILQVDYLMVQICEVIDAIGSQSVSVCMNYSESRFLGRSVRCHKTNKKLGGIKEVFKSALAELGEIILQNITREGNARTRPWSNS